MFIDSSNPKVAVIGGPNGAGKTTIARKLMPTIGVRTFVNADVIAQGLSMFDSESVAIEAGRIMLTRLNQLAAERESFAFETTLASRTFAKRIRDLLADGYEFHLVCVWVPSADISIGRVAHRVSHGGHFVPDETVRRRYDACFLNFFSLYQPIATNWLMLDNSQPGGFREIAFGGQDTETVVRAPELWNHLIEEYANDDAD